MRTEKIAQVNINHADALTTLARIISYVIVYNIGSYNVWCSVQCILHIMKAYFIYKSKTSARWQYWGCMRRVQCDAPQTGVCVCGAFTFISLSNKWFFFCCAQADRILKGGKNAYDKTKQLYSWYVYLYIMYIMCLCWCSQFLLPRHQPTIFDAAVVYIYVVFFLYAQKCRGKIASKGMLSFI